MNISICISTYGTEYWEQLALDRAVPSAEIQNAYEVIVHHEAEGSVSSSRNSAAQRATGEWLLFLDADDELASGYTDAMTRAYERERREDGAPLLLTPRVSYVLRNKHQTPKFWPEKPLNQGNWLVIGTLVPRDLFMAVGGFKDWPHAFEDWALFAACWKAGAEIVKVPHAIYIAHWLPQSRNKRLSREELVRCHYDIGRDLFPDEYPPEWLEQHLRNVPSRQRVRR